MTTFAYPRDLASAIKGSKTLFLAAPASFWKNDWAVKTLPKALATRVHPMIDGAKSSPTGRTVESVGGEAPKKIVAAILPDEVSRHNSPSRIETIQSLAKKLEGGSGATAVIAVDEPEHVLGAMIGIARACPRFSRKSDRRKSDRDGTLKVLVVDRRGHVLSVPAEVRSTVETVRWAAEMIDTPARELTTAAFAAQARKFLRGVSGIRIRDITGQALLRAGLEGIHAVGQAAQVPPRLLILEYRPPRARRTIALVGKGVVYDTGGLSLKPTTSMCGMKGDMGGAAAVIGAFRLLAERRIGARVVAIAALAENALGSKSYRNDDILRLHSGHTVEINNTDAEGRLLLGDAVSYAGRKFAPDVIIDAATLTGAQPIATGWRHAAIVSNRQGLEDLAVECGRLTGDLCWPLPFAPEFFQSEFKSTVADMKNSVGGRPNAASSCAAQFVYNHIDDLEIPWLHIDMAGPSHREERGMGYGVSLMASIVEELRDGHLKA